MRRYLLLFSVLVLAFSISASAQADHTHHPADDNGHDFRHFRIAPLIGHTFVPAGHSREYLAIPSWGLDLEYWFNPAWGIGLHNDLELQSFIIERPIGEEVLEREFPLVTTIDLLYKPWGGLVLMGGPGYEFEATRSFFLFRLGVEYEFELGNHWDLAPSFFYDSREQEYDTWSFALGVGKRF